jgi:hypothetical protein
MKLSEEIGLTVALIQQLQHRRCHCRCRVSVLIPSLLSLRYWPAREILMGFVVEVVEAEVLLRSQGHL